MCRCPLRKATRYFADFLVIFAFHRVQKVQQSAATSLTQLVFVGVYRDESDGPARKILYYTLNL